MNTAPLIPIADRLARLNRIADLAEATLEASILNICPNGHTPLDYFHNSGVVDRLDHLVKILSRLMSVRKTLILIEDPGHFHPNHKPSEKIPVKSPGTPISRLAKPPAPPTQ